MRIAIISDDLIQHGGQERMLEAILEIYPQATLFASVISKEWKSYFDSKNIVYKTSFLDRFPFVENFMRYYSAFLLQNLAYESFDLSDYDLVISNTSRFAHLVITHPKTKHLCYMHTPGRMFWLSNDYFKKETYGVLSPLKKYSRSFLASFLSLMRMLDYVAAQRIDKFLSNSSISQARLKKFYNRESPILYPVVATSQYSNKEGVQGDYFIVVTRLIAWKRVDIAIQACIDLKQKLKIVGGGSDMERLQKLAGNSEYIEFLGPANDEVKIDCLLGSKGLIQTQYEDFGIVPLEANAAGKAVIGYGKGGIVDSMKPGVTAEFFMEQTVDSLKAALIRFDPTKYDIKECRKNAARFDKAIFKENLTNFVNQLLTETL